MGLEEFFLQTRVDVKEAVSDRLSNPSEAFPYEETVFTEIVMEHMSEIGMTFDPQTCHYSTTVGNAKLSLSGYAVSEEADQLDLFVSLYKDTDTLGSTPDVETKKAAEQCLRFLSKCAEGRLASKMERSNDAYDLAITIQESYQALDQIRIYVLTNKVAKAKNFKTREVKGKTVKLEVMDIERLWRHWSEGKPRDELVVNFEEVSGSVLPCVYVPGEMTNYDYALTAIPGEALRFVYEKYGARLLEANVRSFLSATGKVNRGIRDTLRQNPEQFMAYNNGIVLVADEINLGLSADGSPGISWMKGIQVVNGGQTTASIYFTKKKNPEIDLSLVRVPAKIIVLRSVDSTTEEELISDISKYANSQNAVRVSDLSANKPFHIKVEQLSLTTYCPDGISRWFYERANGSYKTLLARDGSTPAKLKKLKAEIPTARKITKTDLAKFLNAWDQYPHFVSFGAQKNFARFMDNLEIEEDQVSDQLPDVSDYKEMISKAIIFKTTQKLIRPMFSAFQANVTAYTVSVLSVKLRNRLNLDNIWRQQGLSTHLQKQIQIWARDVNTILHQSAGDRMVSEWAKKEECWDAVLNGKLSMPLEEFPEEK